jgi:hypothetical protein
MLGNAVTPPAARDLAAAVAEAITGEAIDPPPWPDTSTRKTRTGNRPRERRMKQPDPFTTRATPVDRRLITRGLAVTVADLVAVFIDHRPIDLPECVTCRHRYSTAAPLCPSRTLAAELLKRRQHEDRKTVADVAKELNHWRDTRVLPSPAPARSTAVADDAGLFAVDPASRKANTAGRRPRPAA